MALHQKLYNPQHLKQLASGNQAGNRKLVEKLKACKNREVDDWFNQLHVKFFNEIDCLQCANCCRSLGPRLSDKDIDRLSKYLGLKSNAFTEKYLIIDEDHDYIFKSMPCPFLQTDNICSVYDFRPKACREYPHTDQSKIQGILSICLKNAATCPVVYLIFNYLAKNSLK
jgi:uncharacterized protein